MDINFISRTNVFQAVFVVYRRLNTVNNTYSLVPRSARVEQLKYDVIANTSDFKCMNVDLDPEDYFAIQENDIIGACFQNQNVNSEPLLLVGKSRGSSFLTFESSHRMVRLGCGVQQYRIVNMSLFSHQREATLHLYVDIGMWLC